jgi:hypothetical protein
LEFFSDIILPFNAFHTVVLKINLLETVKHNRYIDNRLRGVLYKIQ